MSSQNVYFNLGASPLVHIAEYAQLGYCSCCNECPHLGCVNNTTHPIPLPSSHHRVESGILTAFTATTLTALLSLKWHLIISMVTIVLQYIGEAGEQQHRTWMANNSRKQWKS